MAQPLFQIDSLHLNVGKQRHQGLGFGHAMKHVMVPSIAGKTIDSLLYFIGSARA
jgi:hypothetical protein